MGQILDVEPVAIPFEDSGTTDKTGITWVRKGNTVTVSIKGYAPSATGSVSITGLPVPKGGTYIFNPYWSNQTMGGFVSYNNGWTAYTLNTGTYFGSFSYVTD